MEILNLFEPFLAVKPEWPIVIMFLLIASGCGCIGAIASLNILGDRLCASFWKSTLVGFVLGFILFLLLNLPLGLKFNI